MKSGSEIIIEMLKLHNIKTVCGIPGGSNLPIYDELANSGIRHILARHEQGAGFIAHGMARSTGKPAVCIATSGPGATNLITAIADAKLDSVPLIAITGQVTKSLIGKDSFQEIDTIAMSLPITKHSYFIESAKDIAPVFKEAFHTSASGRPGPVLIDIPKDVQIETTDYHYDNAALTPQEIICDISEIESAAEMINNAKRPIIIGGGGIVSSESGRLLEQFAGHASIPTASTLMGLGPFDHGNKFYIGFAGMHAPVYTNLIIDEADLIIAIGTRLGDRATGKISEFAPNAKIIHIDTDPSELGKIIRDGQFIRSCASHFLKNIIKLTEKNRREEWMNRIDELMKTHPLERYQNPSHPANIIQMISRYASDDAIITTDVGQHQMWTAQRFGFNGKRKLLTSGGLGTMGFGLPAAIGASLANPDREVICISGDGSFMMNIQELALISELKLNIRIIIINNGELGLVRQQQEMFYDANYIACKFIKRHSFADIAKAFGIRSFRLNGDSFEEFMKHKFTGVVLADVDSDENISVLPMVPPGNANRMMIK